jgi:hypothetical protein
MEAAAVPAETTKPGPLAALALVVALPATLIFTVTWYRSPVPWVGPLVFVCGCAIVVAIGRGTLGVTRTIVLAIATWVALAFSAVAPFAVGFAQAFGNCGGGTYHP